MPAQLTLLAPGLLGPWPGAQRQLICEALELPALGRLLARATPSAQVATDEAAADLGPEREWDLVEAAFEAFAMRREGAGWPAAAVARLVDLEAQPGVHYLRADPVNMRPDPHGAHLLYGPALGLDGDEAKALADEVVAATACRGRLAIGHPSRWYLTTEAPAGFAARAPASVLGRGSAAVLPAGAGGAPWRTWLTEVQMVLHASPVNTAREAAGLPPINSLWLWGGGRLPEAQAVPYDRVLADDAVLAGLAALHGLPYQTRPSELHGADLSGAHLLVAFDAFHGLGRYGAVETWRAALQAFEKAWVAPALRAVAGGQLDAVHLLSAPAVPRTLRRAGLRHFWKRRFQIAHWLVAQ